MKQENEALREQLQHSLIPDRLDEASGGVTDASKEEIESLKVLVTVSTVFITLRSESCSLDMVLLSFSLMVSLCAHDTIK